MNTNENMNITKVETPMGAIVVTLTANKLGVNVDLFANDTVLPLAEIGYGPDFSGPFDMDAHIITRVWGDALNAEHTTQVVHKNIEEASYTGKDFYTILLKPSTVTELLSSLAQSSCKQGETRSSEYIDIAQGLEYPENKVQVALYHTGEDDYYSIHIIDDVNPADCVTHYTKDMSVESIKAVLGEIVRGLTSGFYADPGDTKLEVEETGEVEKKDGSSKLGSKPEKRTKPGQETQSKLGEEKKLNLACEDCYSLVEYPWRAAATLLGDLYVFKKTKMVATEPPSVVLAKGLMHPENKVRVYLMEDPSAQRYILKVKDEVNNKFKGKFECAMNKTSLEDLIGIISNDLFGYIPKFFSAK